MIRYSCCGIYARECDCLTFKAYWLRDAPTSFNIQELYALPTLHFCVLRHLHHKLIGFYNRDEKCLLRGTDRVFK